VLIVDDLLLFPARSLFWIFREIHNAAQQDIANEAESITEELRNLYMMLETGRMSEDEFDRREKELLDRLDVLRERNPEPDRVAPETMERPQD
jgi:hypothetical protein